VTDKKKTDPINLGFHDDELIGLELDLAKRTAVVIIKTFSWGVCPQVKQDQPNEGTAICAKPDKIVKLFLELDDDADSRMYDIELKQTLPESILWAYVTDGSLEITLVQGYLCFRIKSYRKEELK